jgi:hypothetical protein
MPTPPPRHLARPRRPWRLLLFVFGLATAVLVALVASATLLPQPEPPRQVPGVALSTSPTKPAPTSVSSTTTTTTPPRETTTTPPPSTTSNPGRRAVSGPTTTHPIGSDPSAGHGRAQDTNHGAFDRWRHHPAHRDRATDHGRAHHHRANQHGSVDDHVGDHDQHRTHHRADDQRRADHDCPGRDHDRADHDRAPNDHDRVSNDDDRAGDPARQPTSRRLSRDRRCAPAHPGSGVPAARARSTSRRDTRQAAPRQPPPPPRLIRQGARPASNPRSPSFSSGTRPWPWSCWQEPGAERASDPSVARPGMSRA